METLTALPEPLGRPPGPPSWPVLVDLAFLRQATADGDLERLRQLRVGARQARPAVLRSSLLYHLDSAANSFAKLARNPDLGNLDRLLSAAAGGDPTATTDLCRLWHREVRGHASRAAYRFDLWADYLAATQEYLLSAIAALPAALPPADDVTTAPLLAAYLNDIRDGARKHAGREVHRLTKQMTREGVLTWRDHRGRVVEHPALRNHADDPAARVSEQELRRSLKAFCARYGPRLLGRRVWERFRLHFFAGWTQEQIALHHQVSQQAVSESLATAAVKLREAFCAARRDSAQPPPDPG